MIINDDALTVLKHIPSESVGLVVSDLPYRTISGGNKAAGRPVGVLSANDGKIFKHNDIKPGDYMPELFRVLKSPAHCYVMTNELNRRSIEDALLAAGFKIHQLLTWRKNNATPNRWYMKNYEFTFLARKGPARTINDPGSMACHDFDNIIGNKNHPTEKPVDLMAYYVRNSANPGDLVLDPFCGTGAVGVAAEAHGCEFIGIEIDPEYAGKAGARMKPKNPRREMLKFALITAGRDEAERVYREHRKRVMRCRIIDGTEPAALDLDRMIAARDALSRLVGFGYPYDVARSVDMDVFDERDKR